MKTTLTRTYGTVTARVNHEIHLEFCRQFNTVTVYKNNTAVISNVVRKDYNLRDFSGYVGIVRKAYNQN